MRCFLAAAMAVLLSGLASASSQDPIGRLKERVLERTLKNGMKVLVLERHNAPLVSFEMMFRTGGVDEDSGKSGLAHLF